MLYSNYASQQFRVLVLTAFVYHRIFFIQQKVTSEHLGQIGFDPTTMKCVEGGVEAETHQVLKNMGAILKNAGCDYSNGKQQAPICIENQMHRIQNASNVKYI